MDEIPLQLSLVYSIDRFFWILNVLTGQAKKREWSGLSNQGFASFHFLPFRPVKRNNLADKPDHCNLCWLKSSIDQ